MKLLIILFSIIAFVLCLLVGMMSGEVFSNSSQPSPTPGQQQEMTPTATQEQSPTPVIDSNQRNILVIFTQPFDSPSPRLLGVWLAMYLSDHPVATLVNLYPASQQTDPALAQSLAETFSLTEKSMVSTAFWESIKAINVPITGYMMVDQTGMASAVDIVNGLDMQTGAGSLNGQKALAALHDPYEDPFQALVWETFYIEGMCSKLANLPKQVNWITFLTGQVPDHLRTNLPLDLFVQDWKMLIQSPEPLSCKLPIH